MKKSQKILLKALRAALFGGKATYPEDTDWDAVVKEAKEQTVLGLIASVIPAEDEGSDLIMANYMRILYGQDELLNMLDENDIPCVILKGCAAAVYYPKPYLRAMGDIDFLVPHDKFEDAMKLMEDNGYSLFGGKDENGKLLGTGRHVEYMKDGIEYELHHHFSSVGYDIDDVLEAAICRREFCELNGYRVPILPEIENGLVLLGHIRQHIKTNVLGLRQLLDWAVYLNSIKDTDKWQKEFLPAAEKAGLKQLGAAVTGMCEKRLGLPPSPMPYDSEDVKAGDDILGMILKSGNFGRKSTLTKNEKGIESAVYNINRLGLFTYCKMVGMNRLKICEKYPFLSHFAWIYGLFRCIIKGFLALISTKNVRKHIAAGLRRFNILKNVGIRDRK